MSTGATIFDDRETVEFLRDHPHLLAIADAVRATQSEANPLGASPEAAAGRGGCGGRPARLPQR